MAGSGQRAHGQVSGGKSIDDHKAWMGSMDKDSILPMGVKHKDESGVEGAGSLAKYEDNAESIRGQQKAGVNKIKSNPMKPHYKE